MGNRLARIDSVEGTTGYSYDDNDQLTTETLGGNTTRYNYDLNGNTLSRSNNLEQARYNWSAENRLLTATVSGTDSSHALAYQYDDDGIRVAAFVDGVAKSRIQSMICGLRGIPAISGECFWALGSISFSCCCWSVCYVASS